MRRTAIPSTPSQALACMRHAASTNFGGTTLHDQTSTGKWGRSSDRPHVRELELTMAKNVVTAKPEITLAKSSLADAHEALRNALRSLADAHEALCSAQQRRDHMPLSRCLCDVALKHRAVKIALAARVRF